MAVARSDPGDKFWPRALAATLIVSAILRFAGLGSGLWYDEIVTLVESARKPLLEIFVYFPDVNIHPLYSVLAHLSLQSFGESSWALRLPACLFGIASVAMAYLLGTRLISKGEAWAAATILAVSYQHIWFSQNARGYTLMGFFALLSTYHLIRALESGRTSHYVWYALACAAGVYTHLTMGFVVAGHVAVILVGKVIGWRVLSAQSLKPLIAAWMGTTLLSAGLYAPYAPNVLAHFGAGKPKIAAQVATSRWAVTEVLRNVFSGAGIIGAVATGIVAAIGALSFLRRQTLAFALLVVPAIVAGAAIVVLRQPMRPRFFFFIAGAAAIFAGHGVGVTAGWLSRGTARPATAVLAVTAVLVVLSAAGLPRNYRIPKQDFDGAVRYLELQSGDGVVVSAAGAACWPIERYYKKTGWPCVESVDELQSVLAVSQPVLVVYTLGDYIENPELRDRLRNACREVRRFPGTLGGGDMIVCDPRLAAGLS